MSNSKSPASLNWYYAQNDNSIGPVPFATLQALHAAGQITDETFVVEAGSEEWRHYSSLIAPAPLELPSSEQKLLLQQKNCNTTIGESPKSPTSNEKQPTFREGCFGCLGLLIIIGFFAVVIDKCSSSKESKSTSTTSISKVPVHRGDVSLAQPYEIIGSMGGGIGKTVWILAPAAESAEQRAATVYAAAKKIVSSNDIDGNFSVVLAIDREFAGAIPNADHGLYTARATLKSQKFANGKWQSIKHWEVFASKTPRTQESLIVLKTIYGAAKSHNLKWEQDYAAFISQEGEISQEEAETKVKDVMQLGTPGEPFEFTDSTSANETLQAAAPKPIATISPYRNRYIYMEGVNGILFGNTPVSTLEDMVKAVYLGDITPEKASQYTFRTFGGLGEYRFLQTSGEYLIYNFGIPSRETWDAALPRNRAFDEKRRGTLSLERYYEQMKNNKSGAIQAKNAVRIAGMEEFTTINGLVKRLPILECVDL